ncbi:MAG: acyltransferase family protein [Microthrixaceae bacterium]
MTSIAAPSDAATVGAHAGSVGLGHIPALDGLRALAVIAVLIYHGDVGFLGGGFIGVDLFFVLSGFLITSLLLAEHQRKGSIDLKRFWIRRFRRLLPALMVYLVAVAIWAALAADPTTLSSVRRASLSGLGYVANWYFIASGVSYGMAWSAPSPLIHLWSLSVEEQYYVVWPLIAAGLFAIAVARRRPARRLFAIVGVSAALASTIWMLKLAVGGATTDRMYFGTDTRAATILVGVVLAAVLQPAMAARQDTSAIVHSRTTRLATMLGLTGAAVLVTVAVVAHEKDRWLYRGGFALIAVASAAVIAAAVLHPGADRWLSVAPLRWAGTRSYGLYLWHWGVLVALAVAFPQFTGWARLPVAIAITGVITECSFRFIENPIRTGIFRLPVPRLLVPVSFALIAGLLVLATNGAEDQPDYLKSRTADDVEMVAPPSSDPSGGTLAPPATVAPQVPPGDSRPGSAPSVPSPTTEPPVLLRPSRVALVGDSVAASLAPALAEAFSANGMAFANASAPGCGVLEGDPADDRGEPLAITSACSGAIPDLQRSIVKRTSPDLVVVLSSWEAGDRLVDGVWHPFASAEADAQLLRLYDEMLDRLTVGGARVALVTIADPVDSKRGPAKEEQTRRLRHMNDLLEQVATRDPIRASLVRLDEIVCPADPCPKVVDGVELRALDGAHFADPKGAALVADQLVARIAQVPAGSVTRN